MMNATNFLNSRVRRDSMFGFTVIELLVVMAMLGLLVALILPAVQMAREAGRRTTCANHLKQIGMALHAYHSQHRVLPYGVGPDDDGPVSTPGTLNARRYSTHSQILPFLEQAPVYEAIDFSVAPFHPYVNAQSGPTGQVGVNGPAALSRLAVFLCPSDINQLRSRWGPNNYRACNGSSWSGRSGNGIFGQNSHTRFEDVTDGLSSTAMFSERVKGSWATVGGDLLSDLNSQVNLWTEDAFRTWCDDLTEALAATLSADGDGGQTWLEGNMNWTRYNHLLPPNHPSCKTGISWDGVAMTASSRHPAGVNLLLGDGAGRFVHESVSDSVWRALGTIHGGETLSSGF